MGNRILFTVLLLLRSFNEKDFQLLFCLWKGYIFILYFPSVFLWVSSIMCGWLGLPLLRYGCSKQSKSNNLIFKLDFFRDVWKHNQIINAFTLLYFDMIFENLGNIRFTSKYPRLKDRITVDFILWYHFVDYFGC